jgi:hypothetical protein
VRRTAVMLQTKGQNMRLSDALCFFVNVGFCEQPFNKEKGRALALPLNFGNSSVDYSQVIFTPVSYFLSSTITLTSYTPFKPALLTLVLVLRSSESKKVPQHIAR